MVKKVRSKKTRVTKEVKPDSFQVKEYEGDFVPPEEILEILPALGAVEPKKTTVEKPAPKAYVDIPPPPKKRQEHKPAGWDYPVSLGGTEEARDWALETAGLGLYNIYTWHEYDDRVVLLRKSDMKKITVMKD